MKNRVLLVSLFMVVCLLAFGFFFMKMIKEANECVANPFVYGAKQLKEQGYPVKCSCDIEDDMIDDFVFDEKEITPAVKQKIYGIENIGNVTLPGI